MSSWSAPVPRGSWLRARLASRGIHVVVLEEHERIGVPVHCTGVLGLDAFDELGLSRRSIVGTAALGALHRSQRRSVVVDADRVRAAVVDRALFDRDLAARARSPPAPRSAPARASSPSSNSPARSVRGRRRRACGRARRAGVRRELSLQPCARPRRAARARPQRAARGAVSSARARAGAFRTTVAPGGFAWVVPFSRRRRPFARLGLLCDCGAGSAFQSFAATHPQANTASPSAWPEPRLKVLPLAPGRAHLDRSRARRRRRGRARQADHRRRHLLRLAHRTAGRRGARPRRCASDDLRGAVEGLRATLARSARRRRSAPASRSAQWPSRLDDATIDRLIELARVDGIVPLLRQTADFNWHSGAARALLRHAQFRRIVFGAMFQ